MSKYANRYSDEFKDKRPEINYEFISKHSSEFSVANMCTVLDITQSNYYDWKTKEPSQ